MQRDSTYEPNDDISLPRKFLPLANWITAKVVFEHGGQSISSADHSRPKEAFAETSLNMNSSRCVFISALLFSFISFPFSVPALRPLVLTSWREKNEKNLHCTVGLLRCAHYSQFTPSFSRHSMKYLNNSIFFSFYYLELHLARALSRRIREIIRFLCPLC